MEARVRLLRTYDGLVGLGADGQPDGTAWVAFTVDPYLRECECEGDECDPEVCPRFVDECCECGELFSEGYACLDGGDLVCEECVEVVRAGVTS